MNQLNKDIADELYANGADIVGFGDISELPSEQRLNLPIGIAVAVKYRPDVILGIRELPTAEYHEHYNLLNKRLAALAERCESFLKEKGYDAVALIRGATGYSETDYSTRLPLKTVATHAGLGWVGKCDLLVTKKYGSAIRLTAILTNAALDTSKPVNSSGCGNCRACADACPGKAVAGINWKPGIPRSQLYDAFACAEAARRASEKGFGGKDITICGKCIEVCPYTRKYTKS